MSIVETSGLGRRYGRTWALRDCDLVVPEGRMCVLVGPNGAGKSTLLNIVVGLTTPTTGEVGVLGGHAPGSPAALDGIGFVAQDMPVYRGLTVGEALHLTRNLNRNVDVAMARRRLAELDIPLQQKAGSLSGGQQAQLALTLALARHPRLLVLDEPTAPLDPLARHDFMASVMTAIADDGVTVLLSSHMLAELARVADHLVLLAHGRVRLAGTVDDLVNTHRLLTGPPSVPLAPGWEVVESNGTPSLTHALVRLKGPDSLPPQWESRPVGLEELTLAYLRDSLSKPPVLAGAGR